VAAELRSAFRVDAGTGISPVAGEPVLQRVV
jgi:hypothetical protein